METPLEEQFLYVDGRPVLSLAEFQRYAYGLPEEVAAPELLARWAGGEEVAWRGNRGRLVKRCFTRSAAFDHRAVGGHVPWGPELRSFANLPEGDPVNLLQAVAFARRYLLGQGRQCLLRHRLRDPTVDLIQQPNILLPEVVAQKE